MPGKKFFEAFLRGLIYLSFAAPFVVLPTSFIFPFIVPKTIFFRTVVEVMLGAYLILLYINFEEYRPRFRPVALAITFFMVSFGLSTFAGVDAYHSFWDNHERMLGFFTILHYGIYAGILTSVLKDWNAWRRTLNVFLGMGMVVMMAAFIQVLKPDFLLNQNNARVMGTLGNPIYLGGYGLFLAFVAALLFLKDTRVGAKAVYSIAAVMGLLAMFFSGTRGSVLGLAVAIVAAGFMYLAAYWKNVRVRNVLLAIAVGCAIIFGVLYAFRTTPAIANLPAVGRALNTSWEDIKASPRYIAWTIAMQSFKERPVFGWGPNNYFYAFNKYYDPKSLSFGYGETWFDNAHNIIVNTLSVQGIVGLVSYVGLFGAATVMAYRAYRQGLIDQHVAIIGVAFLVAHLAQNITVFENPTSYLYFMAWLAFLNSVTMRKAVVETPDRPLSPAVLVGAALFSVISVTIFNVRPASANRGTLAILRSMQQASPEGGPNNPGYFPFENIRTLFKTPSPHIDDIRSDIARSAAGALPLINQQAGKEKNIEAYNLMVDELKKNIELHPLDIRNHFLLAQLHQIQANIMQDAKYMTEAENVMKEALALSPRRQQLMFAIAAVQAQTGKVDEAVKLLEQALKENPEIGEAYWRLALGYQLQGNISAAQEVLIEANNRSSTLKLINEQDPQLLGQLTNELLVKPLSATPTPATSAPKKR